MSAATSGLTFVVAIAYVVSAPRGVVAGDNPEFCALFGAGGVAHPSGYPLYVLWLRAWSWIPAGTVAHGAALATALLGIATVPVMIAASRAWGVSGWAARIATASYAFASLTWSLVVQAEAFALLVLLATCIVWVAAPGWSSRIRARRSSVLGLLAGLAMANHLSAVLLAPVGFFGVGVSLSESKRPVRDAVTALGWFAVGLLPYGSIFVEARTTRWPWVWGQPRTLTAFFRHVVRSDYGAGSLAATSGEARPVDHLRAIASTFGRETLFVGVACALVGVVLVFVSREVLERLAQEAPQSPRRRLAAHAALVATLLLAGPVFVSRFNLPTTGITKGTIERFHLLPLSLSVPFMGLGLDAVANAVKRRLTLSAQMARFVAGAALAAVVMGAASHSIALVRAQLRPTIDDYLHNVFEMLPKDAIVVGGADHVFGGALYVQRAEGTRRDVDVVNVAALNAPWYRAVVARLFDHPVDLRVSHGGIDADSLIDALVTTGRPVFMIESRSQVRAKFEARASYRLGPLIRILGPGERYPTLAELEQMNVAAFAAFRIERDSPEKGEGWPARIFEDYALAWASLARATRARGDVPRADALLARAQAFAPWMTF